MAGEIQSVVVEILFRRVRRVRVGVDGAPVYRAPVGCDRVRRSFKFRMRPTARQHVALQKCLDAHRELCNSALQERRDAWRANRTRIRYGDQSAQLSEIRVVRPDVGVWSFASQQATLRRLNRAFDGFFRRVKTGDRAGYPRFKSAQRFDSVE